MDSTSDASSSGSRGARSLLGRRFERRWSADLALLLVVVIWGFTFPMVKSATQGAPIFGFLTLRFSLALVAFLPLLRFRTRRDVPFAAHLGPGLGESNTGGQRKSQTQHPSIHNLFKRSSAPMEKTTSGKVTL